MLQLLEVVGTSPEGFSAAVRTAIAKIEASGHKAHFFQVVEQRGAVRDGAIKEFQVILKVAVES
jgi:flavin-binding protein dodecin